MIQRIHIVVTALREQHPYFWTDADRLAEVLRSLPHNAIDPFATPEEADVIVFVGSSDPALTDVRRHHLFQRYRTKCFAYHSGDEPLPTVPGIYASIPKRWFDARVHRAGFYLRASLDRSIASVAGAHAQYLFSFIGAVANHPLRRKLAGLNSDEALIVDSACTPLPEPQARARFIRSIQDSLFVLCPRGGGTSSFRIFEVMQAGRVPVIISDDWVEPMGPDWAKCSVRVPESKLAEIPKLLSGINAATEMGARARRNWEDWFSPNRAGLTLLGWLADLQRNVEIHGLPRMALPMRLRYSARIGKNWIRDRRLIN